jgi:hypothetical protein
MYLLFVAIFGLINAGNAFDKIEAIKAMVTLKKEMIGHCPFVEKEIFNIQKNTFDIFYQSINERNEENITIYLSKDIKTCVSYTFDKEHGISGFNLINVSVEPFNAPSHDNFQINFPTTLLISICNTSQTEEGISKYQFQIEIDEREINLTLMVIDE